MSSGYAQVTSTVCICLLASIVNGFFVSSLINEVTSCRLSACNVSAHNALQFAAIHSKLEYLVNLERRLMILEAHMFINNINPNNSNDSDDNMISRNGEKEIIKMTDKVKLLEKELESEKILRKKLQTELEEIKKQTKKPFETFNPRSLVGGVDTLEIQNLKNQISDFNTRMISVESLHHNLTQSYQEWTSHFNFTMQNISNGVATLQQHSMVADSRTDEIEGALTMLEKKFTTLLTDLKLWQSRSTSVLNNSLVKYQLLFWNEIGNLQTNLTEDLNKVFDEIGRLREIFMTLQNEVKELRIRSPSNSRSQPVNIQDRSCTLSPPGDGKTLVEVDGLVLQESAVLPSGSVVEYKCKNESVYMLKGAKTKRCYDAEWFPADQPVCIGKRNSRVISSIEIPQKYGNSSNPCPEPTGNFRDQYDCTMFYQCSEGHAPVTQICSGNTFFNQNENKCLHKKQSDCH